MINFREPPKGPLADTRSARRWLDTLPVNDPLLVQRELLVQLDKLAERTARRTPSGLEALFAVDAYTRGVVRNLIAQYVEHAGRSSKIEGQLWQTLYGLTQGFQACYAAFAREIKDRTQHSKWQLLLPELVARQIRHLGLDAKLRLFRYERWIPAKWAELHALFTRAFSAQVERQALQLDPKGGTTTIEHQYLVVLMLQLADPGNLTPRQIEWVASQLEDWCRPLRFTAWFGLDSRLLLVLNIAVLVLVLAWILRYAIGPLDQSSQHRRQGCAGGGRASAARDGEQRSNSDQRRSTGTDHAQDERCSDREGAGLGCCHCEPALVEKRRGLYGQCRPFPSHHHNGFR